MAIVEGHPDAVVNDDKNAVAVVRAVTGDDEACVGVAGVLHQLRHRGDLVLHEFSSEMLDVPSIDSEPQFSPAHRFAHVFIIADVTVSMLAGRAGRPAAQPTGQQRPYGESTPGARFRSNTVGR